MLFEAMAVAVLAAAPPNAPAAAVASPAPAVATKPAAKTSRDDEMVCRSGEAELGSLIPVKRRCMTRGQWAQLARDSQDAVRDTQRGGFSTNPGG